MKFSNCLNAYKETGISYLGGVNISAKIKKNQKVNGQMTYILYLAPANQSGYNVCPNSTPECRLGCLATSGRAMMDLISGHNVIKNSRIAKTKLFFEHNEYFMQWLFASIKLKQAMAIRKGFEFSVRLNGTSDIDWSDYKLNGQTVFQAFPEVQFYDYTKNPVKFYDKPLNYHLTFSYSGHNVEMCKKILAKGHNIAVVFNVKNEKQLPETFLGYPVINGDLTDYRVADSKGCVIGLKWKKIANKADNEAIKNSVFVVQV
jgi:hypothetical protein